MLNLKYGGMRSYVMIFLVMILLSITVLNFSKRTVENFSNVQMLTLLNIESLAAGDIDGGQYPLGEYGHNVIEGWSIYNLQAKTDVSIGVYFEYAGRKIPVGNIQVSVGSYYNVKIPVCNPSDGNVCAKTHLDKPAERI